MTQVASRGAARRKRHDRIRLRMEGDPGRPRLAVFRSLNHIYAQVIDDSTGKTLAAASSLEKELRSGSGPKTKEAAEAVNILTATRPARPDSTSKQLTWHESTPTSSRSRSASSRSIASPRSSRAAGASASA